jgi:membrane protease YdiL (CAAX protease family)
MSFLRRFLAFSFVQLIIELLILIVLAILLNQVATMVVTPFHISPFFKIMLNESISLLSLAVVVVLAHFWIERRPFADLGYATRHLGRDLLLGFLIGAVLISLIVGVMALFGWYRVSAVAGGIENFVGLLLALLFMLVVAVFEEGLFRGILLRLVERGLGSWVALAISALVFGGLHLTNPHATLVSACAIMLDGGIMMGGAYLLTRSLWLAIGIHWAWGFFESPIFGNSDSGAPQWVTPLFTSVTRGPEIWTGGTFGPEAGLVALIIATATGIVFILLAVHLKRIYTPSWMLRRLSRKSLSIAQEQG